MWLNKVDIELRPAKVPLGTVLRELEVKEQIYQQDKRI